MLIAKALEHEIPYFYEGFEGSDNRGAWYCRKAGSLNKSN
jgi:hypothetical protein